MKQNIAILLYLTHDTILINQINAVNAYTASPWTGLKKPKAVYVDLKNLEIEVEL